MRPMRFLLAALPCAFLLLAPTSHASTIYSLDTTTGCCGPGPYGSVSLTQIGSNEVQVDVLLLNPFLLGSGGHAGAHHVNLHLPHGNLPSTDSPTPAAPSV